MTGLRRHALLALLLTLLALAGCTTTTTTAPWPEADVPTATFERAAVATEHIVASEAGAAMLRAGGNAVDAAVAASFCLSVVRPYSCGLGGGGFMIIDAPDQWPVALDYREQAPAAVGPDYYEGLDDTASRFGVHAAGVPGTVAGLLHALETYGTLDRATVLAPAIAAAAEGFIADARFVEQVEKLGARLRESPGRTGWAGSIWTDVCRGGDVAIGDIIRNPAQAGALRLISDEGRDAFYRGAIGRAIVQAMEAGGGATTMADLARYQLRVRRPLAGRFGPYEVLTMPPPSSGGIAILQILGMLERRGVAPGGTMTHNDAVYVHTVTEAMKHAFADRARWLVDTDFHPVPVDGLLDSAYLDELAARIEAGRTHLPESYGTVAPPGDDAGTSHISVVDADGMAVACTETINLEFGSLVEAPGFGFMLNDEMDDFTTKRGAANAFGLTQSDRNAPEPGKRPLSSMSPTIVRENGRVRAVAGGAGGPRIITGTLQTLLNVLLFEMEPGEAVSAPRFHHQWMPDRLLLEEHWADTATREALASYGHTLGSRFDVGKVQVVVLDADGVEAASDPRAGGAPAGE